jgi:hypothetical protein
MASEPKTLQEAIVYFSDPTNCREFLVARRWPNGVICPRCGSKNVLFLKNAIAGNAVKATTPNNSP